MKIDNIRESFLLILLLLLFFGSCQKNDEITTGNRVGNYAPDFTLENENEIAVSLTDFKGQVVLVEFWASWCSYCNAEAPELNALYDEYKGSGFEIIGVSIDTNKDAWLKKANDHNIQYVQVNDPAGFESEVVQDYGVTSIPKMFLLDEKGMILVITTETKIIKEYMEKHY